MRACHERQRASAVRDLAVPAALYLGLYAAMNPHAWHGFSRHFLLDAYDGYQNVWNVWWVRHSLVDLHTNPYFTHLLHWPAGVTLLPQTMTPINGLAGIVLSGLGLGLAATVNTIIVASFVATGVTTFWLLRHLRSSYSVALLGGLLFTFSSFHTAHAIGHLQLIALEFVPLFVLAWLRYLEVPTHGRAGAAAVVLFAVILCDYYYACYCVGIAVILLAVEVWRTRRTRELPPARPLATFVVIAAATSGVLLGALLAANHHDPLLGDHHAVAYGLDPVALVLPGGASYWNSITSWYWHRLLPIGVSETSVYLGSVLIVGLVVSALLRRRLRLTTNAAWWIVLAVFGILALGPRLHLYGVTHPAIPLPYAFFARIVPGLDLSGVPVRMTVVVVLAAIVIVSDLVTELQARIRRPALQWLFVAALALLSVVELYPRAVPRSSTAYPAYVTALRRLPHDVGVIDDAAPNPALALYFQTVHGMPMAYGYVSRLPTSASHLDQHVAAALRARQYTRLCTEFHLRYLVSRAAAPGLRVVYRASGRDPVHIYDMQDAAKTSCAGSPSYAATARHKEPMASQ